MPEYGSVFVCLMGMGTVFFGLICLIVLTMIMGKIVGGRAVPAAMPAPLSLPPPRPQRPPPPRRGTARRSPPPSPPPSRRSWARTSPASAFCP